MNGSFVEGVMGVSEAARQQTDGVTRKERHELLTDPQVRAHHRSGRDPSKTEGPERRL